jgi:hypothetical protein
MSVTLASGPRGDYGEWYILQWKAAWSGLDPWLSNTNNAHGPAHLVFAPLSSIHNLLPKLLWSGAWLFSQWLVLVNLFKSALSAKWKFIPAAITIFNPPAWYLVALAGFNDAIVAGLVTIAIFAGLKKHQKFKLWYTYRSCRFSQILSTHYSSISVN